MADHLLPFTLTCEKYTGISPNYYTYPTINYEEVRNDPEMIEQGSPEGSGAVRTFIVKWQDRWAFIDNMMGWAEVHNSGANPGLDGINADVSGFNGKHIHRKLPVGWDMGWYDTSGNPNTINFFDPQLGTSTSYDTAGWVFPVRYICVPHGEKNTIKYVNGSYGPAADYAKISLTYAALDYDIFADNHPKIYKQYNVPPVDGSATTMQEWNRYARIVQKPASIFFSPNTTYLNLVDYPTAGQKTPYPGSVKLLDNIADFWVYLYDLPYDPIIGVNQCFGKVNKYAIFSTPDFYQGQPPETLHFVSADIIRQPLRMGKRYWNAILGFRKVFNYGPASGSGSGTQYYGHNHIRYKSDQNAQTSSLRFYRLSVDGTASLAVGNPFLDVEDFGKLFWIA